MIDTGMMKRMAAALLGMAAAGVAAPAEASDPVLDLPYTAMEMKETGESGTLVLSDCPEYADQTGILASGTVKGDGRIYYYHVNSTGAPARFVMYAESDAPETIEVTKFIQGIPSRDYVTSGASLSFNELTSVRQKPSEVKLAPGVRTILAEDNAAGLLPDYLYTGILEVRSPAPVRFGTALLPEPSETESLSGLLQGAKPVPADRHEMRGSFPEAVSLENRTAWNPDTDGPKALIYGGGDGRDFRKGMDELDRVVRENTGNYGTSVKLTVRTEGTSDFRIYFNPMGGVYLGTFQIRQGYSPSYFRTDDLRYRGRWIGDGTIDDYIDAGVWKAGKPVVIEFMPAGASYLPVRFLFVPADL